MAPGTKHSAAHSGYRSPSPDPRTFHTRAFSLRAKRKCLLLPRRKSTPLSRSVTCLSGQSLLFDGRAMPRVSAEEALHLCTPGLSRRLFVHWEEPARQTVRALAGTPDYKRSQRARYKVEALFAELKQQIKLRKARLRRLWNVAEQFYLAATAQNLKRLMRHLAQEQAPDLRTSASHTASLFCGDVDLGYFRSRVEEGLRRKRERASPRFWRKASEL